MRDDDADGRRKPIARHEIGQDLSALSVHELEERTALLREEIRRLEEEAARKTASRASADAFFRT